jgi:transposase
MRWPPAVGSGRNSPGLLGIHVGLIRPTSSWHVRCKSGVFDRIFKLLASDADNEYMMIDASIVRAHQHSAGARKKNGAQAIGRSRGGLTTKIHALVDALGQDHDLTCAEPLIENSDPEALIGDKAYDADPFVETLTQRGITPVIPPKADRNIKRECDFALYCERNLIERFFNRLKHFRAIATRYDKLARNFLAGTQLAAVTILLN